jgi:hypothetical protein
MGTSDPLLDEIAILLSHPDGRDDLSRLERTLTDGYAGALALEAERSRLQKKIGQMASTVEQSDPSARKELSALVKCLATRDEDLGRLRALLTNLRSRYSAAIRAKTGVNV